MRLPRFRSIVGRVVTACVLLVLAPLGAAWVLGLYDAIDLDGERQALEAIGAEVGEHPDRLTELAERKEVFIRRLGPQGEVLQTTDPGLADGRVVPHPMHTMADFFFGPEGAPTIDTVEEEAGELAVRPEVLAARRGRARSTVRVAASGGLAVVYRTVPLPDGDLLVLARGRRRSARSLYDSRYQLLKLSLVLCLAALLVGGWLAWTLVGPIRALRRRIDGGEPLDLPRDDEIGVLAREFEALRRRLQDRLGTTTKAAADLAHALKSPAAAIATASDLMRSEQPMDEARRNRIAAALEQASQRMSATLDSVLSLAELDEALFAEARRRVDVREIVEAVVQGIEPAPRVVLPEDPVAVLGVQPRLVEALQNLVDNAVAFSDEPITIEVIADDDRVIIAVEDDGPGVGEGERERIFDRFYSGRAGGTGLGLPIARAVAVAHDGSLTLVGASRFELSLPVADT